MTGLVKLKSVEDLLAYCENVERTQLPADAAQSMCGVYADSKWTGMLTALDPFSQDYEKLCLSLYGELSGVLEYDPLVNERTPYVDLARTVSSPTPFQYGDSLYISDFMLSWGWIFRNLNVKAGARILEYGAGEAQLSIQLARMGCDVAIVDIDERYLDAVKAQCDSLKISMELQKGQFGDAIRDRRFDRIVFFEAFHHALHHAVVLEKLKPLLAEGGFILFSGEPIVDPASVLVPFAWGPRLDGISVRSMRKFGWCELGFQRPYFVERLMRSGYLVTHSPCPVTGRGDCFMAKPMPINEDIAMGLPYLLEVHGSNSGWHEGEVSHRWTSDRALFTLPQMPHLDSATVRVVNYLPEVQQILLRCGPVSVSASLASGERATLTLKLPRGERYIVITTPAKRPQDVLQENADSRCLGIAVETIRLETEV